MLDSSFPRVALNDQCIQVSNKNKPLATCLLVLISSKFASVIAYFAQLYPVTSDAQLSNTLSAVRAMGAVFVFVDTTLAITLVTLLRRRKTGFDRMDSVLNRIMIYTIGTGLITGAWSLVGLLTSIFLSSESVYLLVYFVMPKRESLLICSASLLMLVKQSISSACSHREPPLFLYLNGTVLFTFIGSIRALLRTKAVPRRTRCS